uniref:G-protein coupled receptors family 1 profile domain-containing protein n=1 Tax=Anopheles atroparvus TaxID=41427 RepID=A0A182IZU8_ANOAO
MSKQAKKTGQIGPFDVIQALFIVLLTFLVISANLMVILVINSRRYALYIQPQPRYLLTSLALNDLAIGLLIIPFSALPALLHCWPYGEIFCQIQPSRLWQEAEMPEARQGKAERNRLDFDTRRWRDELPIV